jgi:SAM-dependent methyltransferase
MEEQRFTFNAVALLYDASRPSYPDQLFDDVIAEGELAKGERILEVGSGTGKATEKFARRGFSILAVEPGAQMIVAAKKALADFNNVSFEETTFEGWEPDGGTFGIVAAAQSWHWVDPATSFAKAAKVLRLNGVLAIFGHAGVGSPLADQFQQIYRRHLPDFVNAAPERAWLNSELWVASFDASGLFKPVMHKVYPWRWTHTAKSYTDYLGTLSHHRLMEPKMRDAILADIAEAITAYGGSFEMDMEAHLYMAHPKAA